MMVKKRSPRTRKRKRRMVRKRRKKTRSDQRRNAKKLEKTTQPRSEYDPSKPVYGAVNGRVFDVTTDGSFYGPGGPYAMFAGKDTSRALAKMSKNDEDISPSLDGLNETEIGVLNDWENNQVHRNIKSFVFSVKGAIFCSLAMEDQLNQQLPRQYMQRLEHALEIPAAEVEEELLEIPEVSADEAEPVKLSKQVLESSETAMHDKIWVGKVLSDKKLNKVGVKVTIRMMWEDGNRVPSFPCDLT